MIDTIVEMVLYTKANSVSERAVVKEGAICNEMCFKKFAFMIRWQYLKNIFK